MFVNPLFRLRMCQIILHLTYRQTLAMRWFLFHNAWCYVSSKFFRVVENVSMKRPQCLFNPFLTHLSQEMVCMAVVVASVCLFSAKMPCSYTTFITLFVSEVLIWEATEIRVVVSHWEIGRKVKINNKRMEFVCYADTANYHLILLKSVEMIQKKTRSRATSVQAPIWKGTG